MYSVERLISPKKRALFIFVLSIVLNLNTLRNGFVFDDRKAIIENNDIKWNQTTLKEILRNDFWGTPLTKLESHKSFRPLVIISFGFNFFISELNPFSYHLFNVILYAISCTLFFNVTRLILKLLSHPYPGIIAFYSSILFTVHPVHTEAVASIVGRAELLCSIFYLLSVKHYLQERYIRSMNAAILSCLSKEHGMTVFFFIILLNYELQKNSKLSKAFSTIKLLIIFSVLFFVRLSLNGSEYPYPVFNRYNNPASKEPFVPRILTYNYLYYLNALILIWPFNLCCDWSLKSIEIVKSIYDLRNLYVIIFYAILVYLLFFVLKLRKTKNRNDQAIGKSLIISSALTVIPFIPSMNIFTPVGFVIAERVLYLPSAGFCLFTVILITYLVDTKKKVNKTFKFLFMLVIIAFTVKTFLRNFDWYSEYTLYKSGISINPKNSKLYSNLAHYYEEKESYTLAMKYYLIANDTDIDNLNIHSNIARIRLLRGELTKAEEIMNEIKNKIQFIKKEDLILDRNYYFTLEQLAKAYEKRNRLEDAKTTFSFALKIYPTNYGGFIEFGHFLNRIKHYDSAARAYKKALSLRTSERDHANLQFNVAVMLNLYFRKTMQENKLTEEEQVKSLKEIMSLFYKVLEIDPYHSGAILNLSILFQKYPNVIKEKKGSLLEIMENYEGPMKDRVVFNLGMIHFFSNDIEIAEYYIHQSYKMNSSNKLSGLNLVQIYLNSNRERLAKPIIGKLLKLYPDDKKVKEISLSLMKT